ncbi:adaptin N terminal region-domain-containing protein [Infundibulicybe gibba]|nr:adaptin N terminal region-domain-containing protein [Infundibulicybe gibba]
MATSMRGLTQFIADIRGARVRELEEKRINKEMANIRKKFKDGNLDGYQKKKYVAKIIFTYILGYKVDVGHMEAVNLISSSKYSEKQIGYLAVTLLMHENSDFLRLVVNSIRKDLDGNNEIDNCLALHAIANVGGSEMAEALAEDVHRLLISPTSQSFVKKKAALTLLRLYRKHPDVLPATEWALRIVSIMDDQDLGVVICVTSLVMALAQDHLDAYAVCYTKAVDRLHRLVIEHEYSATYAYYKVPSPWLQVKLLRLLQHYPPSEDPTIRSILHQVLQTTMNNSAEPSSPLVTTAAVLWPVHLFQRTNVRYLGLDTMAHLAARADSLDPIKRHQSTIIFSLRDKDISVRRRALDLLYSMCDIDNSELIVGELLRYLKVADYALREEMVLKIAILTEKYASSYKWYVDTILQLISAAGDHVGDEVWYRVVQIVTNTEDLQEYAAKAPSTHESLVKVGGYILGEYGHLIANEIGYSPGNNSKFCILNLTSALLGRLDRKHGDTEDKRTWIHGGKDANLDREITKRKIQDSGGDAIAPGSEIIESLAGLEISASSGPPDTEPSNSEHMPRLTAGPSADRWVLYEDVQIQVGVKSRYQGHIGQLAVYIGNKISAPLTSFTAVVSISDPTHSLLSISFLAGSHQTIAIRLPIVVTKFFEHVKLGQAEFFERWKLIGGPPRESQSVFPIELTATGQLDLTKHRQVVSGHRLGILDDIDPNPSNLVAAGVLHMSVEGKVGCLLRLEPNRDAKLCRLTLRSTSEDVASEVQKLVQKPLKATP